VGVATLRARTPRPVHCVDSSVAPILQDLVRRRTIADQLPRGWLLDHLRVDDGGILLGVASPKGEPFEVRLLLDRLQNEAGHGRLFHYLMAPAPPLESKDLLLRAVASVELAVPADARGLCPMDKTSGVFFLVAGLVVICAGAVLWTEARRNHRLLPASVGVAARLGLAIMGALLGMLLLELGFRLLPPLLAIQTVRGATRLHGVPVWGSQERQHHDCVEAHPERQRIFIFGDSIASVPVERPFPAILEDRLNAWRPLPGFCVMSFAQPGFGLDQSLALATDELPRERPVLSFWEIWAPGRHYVMLGDTAYNFDNYTLTGAGVPSPWGLEVPLGRWWFENSRLYQFMSLRLGQPRDVATDSRIAAQVRQMGWLLSSTGTKGFLLFGAELDKPFSETAATVDAMERLMMNAAREQGMGSYRLADLLTDQDYLALRLDSGCHYNTRGHEVIARILEGIVRHALTGGPPGNDGAKAELVHTPR
jgi:hypothetical protein